MASGVCRSCFIYVEKPRIHAVCYGAGSVMARQMDPLISGINAAFWQFHKTRQFEGASQSIHPWGRLSTTGQRQDSAIPPDASQARRMAPAALGMAQLGPPVTGGWTP